MRKKSISAGLTLLAGSITGCNQAIIYTDLQGNEYKLTDIPLSDLISFESPQNGETLRHQNKEAKVGFFNVSGECYTTTVEYLGERKIANSTSILSLINHPDRNYQEDLRLISNIYPRFSDFIKIKPIKEGLYWNDVIFELDNGELHRNRIWCEVINED